MTTEAIGIFQSDVIIRTALTLAINDLRTNPWLQDHIFASLKDDVTKKTYGEKEIKQAKDWFSKTDIPVVMDYLMDDMEGNFITISLVDSSETENTLGDIHYQPTEDVEAPWAPLVSQFTPEAYSITTGIMRLPTATGDALVVTTGMSVVDRTGVSHAITDVIDRYTIVVAPGTNANFTDAVIKGTKPRLVQELESLCFKETYRIGVHAHGEPFHLTWLHSIVTFCLLRYKQEFLEARGFERSVIASAPFAKNEAMGKGENYWTRFISITGYVRQFWPKNRTERVLSTFSEGQPFKISRVGETATRFVADGFTADDAPWLAQDGLGTLIE